ncbi:MAG: hypothetical protein HY319_14820 [Armatimonadetes bacterium]|nr:hypothetical protein [Armatimonadota bacterium]
MSWKWWGRPAPEKDEDVLETGFLPEDIPEGILLVKGRLQELERVRRLIGAVPPGDLTSSRHQGRQR